MFALGNKNLFLLLRSRFQLSKTDNPDNQERHVPIGEVEQDNSVFAAFRVYGFGRIWASILSGNSGRFSLLVVAGWEAYNISQNAFWSSIIAFCILGPVALVGPIAGSAADRLNKASQMALGQLVALVSALSAAVIVASGHMNLPVLMLTTTGVGIGNAIQNPAWSSLVPAVIGVRRMVNGGAMVRIAQQGAEFLGPALATPLLVRFGAPIVYVLCAAFYAIGLVLALSLRSRIPHKSGENRGIYHPLKEALIYVSTRQKLLGALLVLVGFHCGLTMAYTGIVPKLAHVNLAGDGGVYGELLTAVGIGAILGAVMVIVTARWLDLKFMLAVTGAVSGLSLVVLGTSRSLAVAVLGAVLVGASQSAFMALYLALLQGTASPEFRGRVAAFSNILVGSTMSSFALLWGALTNVFSVEWVFIVPGLAFVIVVGLMLVMTSWLRPEGAFKLLPAQ